MYSQCKKKCSPTAISYYKTSCSLKHGDLAAWVVKPPVKKPKKMVSTTPSSIIAHHYYINLCRK